MATIFGTNLSTSTASTSPPWLKTLGGVEVHLVPLWTTCGTPNPPANVSCELVADLVYVSPTQINFVVPDVSPLSYGQSELALKVVFVRDGVLFDGLLSFYISPGGDFAIFQAGYDCLFSESLVHPEACGYSGSSGQYRVPIGAITDIRGNLITSLNPIHQGNLITLWSTGIGPVKLNPTSGLLEATPFKLNFQVISGPLWENQAWVWGGESPQFLGLDQINLLLPSCSGASTTIEQRYDVNMPFRAPAYDSNLGIGFATLYLPFVVSVEEPSCF
jgi:hypothetical protein